MIWTVTTMVCEPTLGVLPCCVGGKWEQEQTYVAEGRARCQIDFYKIPKYDYQLPGMSNVKLKIGSIA